MHQLIEAFTWWGLEGLVPAGVGEAATSAYLVIAFLLPFAVPLAIGAVERDSRRRRMVVPFVVLGGAVSTTLLVAMATGPVSAAIADRYIVYDVNLDFGGQITALYVIATCVPLLLSSRRSIVVFGALNLMAVAALATLLAIGVISLWCAWAAVASLVIVAHLRTAEDRGGRLAPIQV